MLCLFLLTTVLLGEVVSFSEKIRILRSGCQYSRCEPLKAAQIFGFDNLYSPTGSKIFDFYYTKGAESVTRNDIAACPLNQTPAAIMTTSLLPKSELAVLFSNAGLCGRRDIMELREFSLKQRGLLLEENLNLMNDATQLCLEYSMPWLERLTLEHGLLKFRHLGVSKGERVPEDDRERKLWDADISLFLPRYPGFIKKVANLRDYVAVLHYETRVRFYENNMWQALELAPWPLASLHIAFKSILFGETLAPIHFIFSWLRKNSRKN